MSGDPYPKTVQLARGERRYHRKVASPKRWAQIADAKQGPCRVCYKPAPNQLHHLISRAQSGADTESNIVALCPGCHQAVTVRDRRAVTALLTRLTDAEYAYMVDHAGEDVFERGYGIAYERVGRRAS